MVAAHQCIAEVNVHKNGKQLIEEYSETFPVNFEIAVAL